MSSKDFFFGMIFFIFPACTAYQLEPLGMNHPANAQAMASPALPLSTTLAYSRADMSDVKTAVASESRHEGHHPAAESNAQKIVIGEGKVIATVPSANQVVVEHGEIKGFMDAMTMGYRVEPPSVLDGVNSGDQVRFTIDIPKKTIIKIEKK